MYPDVINNQGDEEMVLKQLSNSYLYKDLLAYKNIRKPDLIPKLLKALALQGGNEVSNNELANLLQVSKDTIALYIDLLEKAFIIYRLDYVEERGGKFYAYEFKWNPRTKAKFSKPFVGAYQAEVITINRDNFDQFVMS